MKKVIAEKDTELKEKDEEIKRFEKRMMSEKDKIIEQKDDEITNLTNKVEGLEKERDKTWSSVSNSD